MNKTLLEYVCISFLYHFLNQCMVRLLKVCLFFRSSRQDDSWRPWGWWVVFKPIFQVLIVASCKNIDFCGLVNPNSSWLNSRGVWLSYSLGVLVLHLVLLCIPVLSTAQAWTLTNVIHNMVCTSFLFPVKLLETHWTPTKPVVKPI